MSFPDKIIVNCDGGSRGNPGPAAVGVVIRVGASEKEYSKFLGEITNNEAEYGAAIFALKKIKQLIGKEKTKRTAVEIMMDSELVARQMKGEYKIKEKKLIPLFIELWNLKTDFGEVKFVQIPREKNKKADALVNRELNSRLSLF